MMKPRIVVDNVQPLNVLIDDAKQAYALSKSALQLDDKQARQDAHIRYGQALIPLRKAHASDKEYNDCLKQHGMMELGNRHNSNCRWLAENESGFGHVRNRCPDTSPEHMVQWFKEQLGQRVKSKRTQQREAFSSKPNTDPKKKSRWENLEADREAAKTMVNLEPRIRFLWKSLMSASAEYSLIQEFFKTFPDITLKEVWYADMHTHLERIQSDLKHLTPLFMQSQNKLGDEVDIYEFFGIKK